MSTTWDQDFAPEGRLASSSATQQDVLGFVDPRREIGRAAKIWMKLLHQITMRPGDVGVGGALLKSENLISLILGNRAGATRAALTLARAEAPRVRVRIACRTPSGKPAIQIRV